MAWRLTGSSKLWAWAARVRRRALIWPKSSEIKKSKGSMWPFRFDHKVLTASSRNGSGRNKSRNSSRKDFSIIGRQSSRPEKARAVVSDCSATTYMARLDIVKRPRLAGKRAILGRSHFRARQGRKGQRRATNRPPERTASEKF